MFYLMLKHQDVLFEAEMSGCSIWCWDVKMFYLMLKHQNVLF